MKSTRLKAGVLTLHIEIKIEAYPIRRQWVEQGGVHAADSGEPRAIRIAPPESRANHGWVRSRSSGVANGPLGASELGNDTIA